MRRIASRASVCGLLLVCLANGQTPGRNVNMVSGTTFPDGDPYLQRQNEPSIAVSSRNPLHLLAGANDYRAVDLPGLPQGFTADAWLGVFKSLDGGNTWKSTLLPGCPQDIPQCAGSPLKGFQAGADPVVRAGTNGLFYYAGIAFNRGTSALGTLFVARFIDNNNTENGDPIQYLGTVRVDNGTSTRFVDKPWLAVDIPRTGAINCSIGNQVFPGGNVYMVYSAFTGLNNEPADIRAQLLLSRSRDCGATWSAPVAITDGNTLAQGASIAIDPSTGAIWVVWREFATQGRTNAMFVSRSTNAGLTFSAPVKIADINPFDQPANFAGLRTNSYPSIAVDGSSPARAYVVWTQRGLALGDDSRVVISSSTNGTTWSAPVLADPFVGRGHQLMPSLVAAGGKLALVYYDQRETQTAGELRCPFVSCATPSQFSEVRRLAGDLAAGQVTNVFNFQLMDAAPPSFNPGVNPITRRQSLDVRFAQAIAGPVTPVFTSVRVSEYAFGNPAGGTQQAKPIDQLRYNAVNVPLFVTGTRAFLGDYLDVAASPAFVAVQAGTRASWRHNTSANVSTTFHAAWTDNRDVVPPRDGNWASYTPPKNVTASVFDPSQNSPVCAADRTGMRNQNIYTSRIANGLFFGSPNNTKPLSPTIQRSFILFLQNTTAQVKHFRIVLPSTILPGGTASLLPGAVLAQLDVSVAARSSVTRSVFATSADTKARITVNVQEITGPGGAVIPGGLFSSTLLNSDSTNPRLEEPVLPPGTPPVSGTEVFNPDLTNPDLTNPDLTNPDLTNPDLTNPDLTNPDLTNPDLTNPGAANPDLTNPVIANPDLTNPDLTNPDLTNNTLTDATYRITNKGNTVAPYTVRLVKRTEVPAGFKLQLVIYKVYTTPGAAGCTLSESTQNQLVANIVNPRLVTPAEASNPDLTNPDLTNATLYLEPGQTARVTLRILAPTVQAAQTFVENNVAPAIVSQAPNVGPGQSGQPASTLIISTATLPEGSRGVAYNAPLTAIGGVGNLTWSIVSGSLPQGLSLNPTTGVLGGIPAIGGIFAINVLVRDSSLPVNQTGSKTFQVRISDTLSIVTPAALPALKIGVPPPYSLTAAGGIPPLLWNLSGGTLPPGISLSSAGNFNFAPTAEGNYTFNATVRDSAIAQQTQTRTFSVTVGPAPLLGLISPASGVQGQVVPVAITGVNTGFAQGATTIQAGVGIVSTNVVVTGPTSLTADLLIPANEPLGLVDLRVITNTEIVSRRRVFNVLARPILLGVTPLGSGRSQTLNVDITGAGTNFLQGVTTVSFSGNGITVNTVTVLSKTLLRANLTIAANADLTIRNITYATGAETDTLLNAFTVADVIGNVQGIVYQANGITPAPGALVRLYRNNLPFAITFANILGAFTFNGVSGGPFSAYALDATGTLVGSSVGNVVSNGQTVTQNVVLGGLGNLSVTVRDPNNNVLPNATVYLLPDSSQIPAEFAEAVGTRVQTTDAAGQTTFASVLAGPFVAIATDPLVLRSGTVSGTVAGGSTGSVQITLTPAEMIGRIVAVLNGPAPNVNALPAGSNEVVSRVVSVLNGATPDVNALPAGSNEVLSRVVSVFNGATPDANALPAGGNEVLSKVVSVGNTPVIAVTGKMIGINFHGGSSAAQGASVSGTAGVGIFAQNNWNNVAVPPGAGSGSANALRTELNEVSAASVSWNANAAFDTGIALNTDNDRLMRGYLDVFPGSPGTVTVTNLPFSSYRVIVYFDGANFAENQVASFSIGSQTIFARDAANSNFVGGFLQVPSSSTTDGGSATPAGNYVIFEGVSGSSFTLTATARSSSGASQRARINAVQIISTAFSACNRCSTTISNENFEGSSVVSSAWSPSSRNFMSFAGTTRGFLGPFTNETATYANQIPVKHTSLRVSFVVIARGAWDGNEPAPGDRFQFTLDGKTLVDTTFRNISGGTQSFPYNLPGGGQAPLTNATQTDGFFQGSAANATYGFSFVVPHTSPTVSMTFAGINLDSASESWGLDSVTVEAIGPSFFSPGDLMSVALPADLPQNVSFQPPLVSWNPATQSQTSFSNAELLLSFPAVTGPMLCQEIGPLEVTETHALAMACLDPLRGHVLARTSFFLTAFEPVPLPPGWISPPQLFAPVSVSFRLGLGGFGSSGLFRLDLAGFFAQLIQTPAPISGLVGDRSGQLYVAYSFGTIDKLGYEGGFVSQFATGLTGGIDRIALDDEGNLYVHQKSLNTLLKYRQRRSTDPAGSTSGIFETSVASVPLADTVTYHPGTGLLYAPGTDGRMYVFNKALQVVATPPLAGGLNFTKFSVIP